MQKSLERIWVSFLDSPRFRRFANQRVGMAIFRSPAYRSILMQYNYVSSYYKCLAHPSAYKNVKTFCLFIGHNKSGTSLIGSLLDAHPNVILADEVNALAYVSAGFKQDQIYHILLKGSRRELMKGRVTARRLKPYSYLVPGQWQGRYSTLQVIGDSTSGSSTQRFAREPDLLQRLERSMAGVEVKFIQVIRNPFDPISAMMIRGKRSFENAIEHYFANSESLVELRKRIDSSNLMPVRYEDFINGSGSDLENICHYLGINADSDYLKACQSILHKHPDKSRQMVKWEDKWIRIVEDKIGQYDFLQGYSFNE